MGNAFGRPAADGWWKTLRRFRAGSGRNAEGTEDSYRALIEKTSNWAKRRDGDSDSEEEVGFPVKPQRPLCSPTYKTLIDLSHFIKEKGGLEGLYWSQRRQDILILYCENEWGLIGDFMNYTDGPGTRYPLTFGWLWQLEPVACDEYKDPSDETQCLLHSSQLGVLEDPWGERLIWHFNPMLAVDFIALKKQPAKIQNTAFAFDCKRK
ncbi:nef protein [Simian immunodeficiency virus]|uniref:Protein Nef n=1 Tax=Simian immunodeficiency virus TaxID=11723 RepID=O90279_SIV|nr:nef protein [Simian immunodeficiency virus]